jgi:hypothetical protein
MVLKIKLLNKNYKSNEINKPYVGCLACFIG